MTKHQNWADEPLRILAYRYFSALFTGQLTELNSEQWSAITKGLGIDLLSVKLNEESFQRAWAYCYYGVGDTTLSMTQSSWSNEDHQQCGPSCLSAQQSYRKAGVRPETQETHLLADHLGVMLGFMAWCLEARPSKDRIQPELFFAAHFGKWIDLFCRESSLRLTQPDANRVIYTFKRFIQAEREAWLA